MPTVQKYQRTLLLVVSLGDDMTDRSRSKTYALRSIDPRVSRRDILRMGGVIIPAGILLPSWMTTARAQSAPSTFNYYVSPTGSDSNPGTLASPWAITSLSMAAINSNNRTNWNKLNGTGVSVGIIAGNYDCSVLQGAAPGEGSQESNGLLQFPGGTSSTPNYFASCNSSGQYAALAATLDMKGSSGLYGAEVHAEGPLIAHTGSGPPSGNSYAVGNLIIDGLVITGFSYKGIRIGGQSSGDGPPISGQVTIQNCEFTGGGHNSSDSLDNAVALWMDGCSNWLVTNNLFYNNAPWTAGSNDHLNAINAGYCQNGTIQYNTVINAGNIYGKSFGSGTTGTGDEGTILQYNYQDTSMYTIESYGLQDFTGYPASGLTATTTFRNNIVLATLNGISGYSATSNWPHGFTTPVKVYNNTLVMSGGTAAIQIGMSNSSSMTIYNNICTGSVTPVETSGGTVAILDYNLGSKSVSGGGSHDITGAPTFVGGTPTLPAQAYQLTSGSLGKGTGSTTGTSSGSACDMGAWGGATAPTQIGCNFGSGTAGAVPVPNPPTLTVS
jgi:hypothetical protein